MMRLYRDARVFWGVMRLYKARIMVAGDFTHTRTHINHSRAATNEADNAIPIITLNIITTFGICFRNEPATSSTAFGIDASLIGILGILNRKVIQR